MISYEIDKFQLVRFGVPGIGEEILLPAEGIHKARVVTTSGMSKSIIRGEPTWIVERKPAPAESSELIFASKRPIGVINIEVGTTLTDHVRAEIKNLFHEVVEEHRPHAYIVGGPPTEKEVMLALELAEAEDALRRLASEVRSHGRFVQDSKIEQCARCQRALSAAEALVNDHNEEKA